MKQSTEHRGRVEIGGIADDHTPTHRLGAGLHNRNRLRMAIAIDEECIGLRFRHAPRHRHGFRGSGRFVEQRGVGDLEPRQIDDHGLKIQQCLESPLADLRLIRRIGRVPGRALEHIALNDSRQMAPVISLADKRDRRPVARRHFTHLRQQLRLGQRAPKIQRPRLADIARDRLVD